MQEINVNDLKEKKILGRCGTISGELPIFWNGGGIEVNVKGAELSADIYVEYETREIWCAYLINGAFMGRFMLSNGLNHICLFRGMNPEAVKNVKILRETQPIGDDPKMYMAIRTLYTDGTFERVKEGDIKIEFVGDSLTTGEGTYGAKEEKDWLPMFMSCSRQYAYMVADMLNADVNIVSQSGWGVHCAYDNNIYKVLPKVYEQKCGPINSAKAIDAGAHEKYDFTFNPDVIVINLGTNDQGSFDNPAFTDPATGITYKMKKNEDGSFNEEDVKIFTDAVTDFLKMVRKNNPDAYILWLYGMCGAPLEVPICTGIKAFASETGDKRVDYMQLPAFTEDSAGALNHPGLSSHMQAAMLIAAKIKALDL